MQGLVGGLLGGLLSGQVGGLVRGLPGLLVFGLVGGLLLGLRRRSRTQPSEKLRWSWNSFLQGLVGGLVGGLLGGPLGGLLCGGLFGGLSDTQVDVHSRLRPNQGIQTSGGNALRSMVVFGLVPGLVFGLIYRGPRFWLVPGLEYGLIFGLVGGGLAYLQHYGLRFLLWRSGAMPWRYVRFLKETTERILLQRVGGGYRFIHPLFLDYFASLGTPVPPLSVPSPPSRQP